METFVVPAAVLLVTLAVDVQLRYLATLTMGWAADGEAWVLAYENIEGDPRDRATLLQYVQALGPVRYPRAGEGEVPIHFAGIDSGFATDAVWAAVHAAPRRAGRWVFATKGVGGRSGEPIVLPTRDERDAARQRGRRPLLINADGAKAELMACLSLPTPGRGYWHIPRRVGAGFIAQLTAEEERTKLDRDGMPVGTEWKRLGDRRNEALDCAVISLALFHHVRPVQWLGLLQDRHGLEAGLATFRSLYPAAAGAPAAPLAAPSRDPWIIGGLSRSGYTGRMRPGPGWLRARS